MEIYKKIKVLGKEGCVEVYKQIRTNEIYAIQEFSAKRKGKEEIQKMQNEAAALKKINSLYVVKCYDHFVENSKMYIVMKYCSHGTLRDLIKRTKKRGALSMKDLCGKYF